MPSQSTYALSEAYRKLVMERGERVPMLLRRRKILHFALRRRNFIPLFYRVSERFLAPFKIVL